MLQHDRGTIKRHDPRRSLLAYSCDAATAILFIIIIALAGLGKVVVKALGGEQVKYPAGSKLVLAEGTSARAGGRERGDYQIPAGAKLIWPGGEMELSSPFTLHSVD